MALLCTAFSWPFTALALIFIPLTPFPCVSLTLPRCAGSSPLLNTVNEGVVSYWSLQSRGAGGTCVRTISVVVEESTDGTDGVGPKAARAPSEKIKLDRTGGSGRVRVESGGSGRSDRPKNARPL